MKRKMTNSMIQILCIVYFASSVSTSNIPEIKSEEEAPRTSLVWDGRLVETWMDNLTEIEESIDLSNLGIQDLHSSNFREFVNLNELNLSFNNLQSTRRLASALQQVKPLNLDVSHNNLGCLQFDQPNFYDDRSYKQSKTFSFDSKYFWSVDLSHNSLRGIGIDFDAMHLNLSNNLFDCHNAIESRHFYGNPIYVGNLDLSHNSINCQSSFFTSNIVSLDMSYNDLKQLDGLLSGLVLLTELNLGHNNIRYIHPEAFKHTIKLRKLNLHSNKIRTIYKQVWSPIPSIGYIDLSSNLLEHMEWDTVFIVSEPRPIIEVNIKNNSKFTHDSSLSEYFRFCDGYHIVPLLYPATRCLDIGDGPPIHYD